METSLFSINPENYDPEPQPQQPQPTDREAVLRAMLSVSAGRNIMLDTSVGKRESLLRLLPQSRGLRKLINTVSVDGDTSVRVNGIDEAIEILETMDDIVMNKFTVPTPLDV
ncbi:p12 [Spodoptera frugiperda granulovirus]|uniref:p12 n=1 Tax=Spodoptera frugiperda granulovirus TaxID=307454 RepID=A0A0C5AUW2_9BBAC|nr:p12 [Spodoptera frugiperda granulovirus]AJK91738.1 p12 [Spodoptera frugiperda granulovirus]AXS01101.1 p12 [Spodoptera frugiperda granulovirus]